MNTRIQTQRFHSAPQFSARKTSNGRLGAPSPALQAAIEDLRRKYNTEDPKILDITLQVVNAVQAFLNKPATHGQALREYPAFLHQTADLVCNHLPLWQPQLVANILKVDDNRLTQGWPPMLKEHLIDTIFQRNQVHRIERDAFEAKGASCPVEQT